MPEKLKKMIGVVILVCSIGGVSCVGALRPALDRVSGALDNGITAEEVKK